MIVKFIDGVIGSLNCNNMKLLVAQCSMENTVSYVCKFVCALQVFTSECIVVIRVNVSVSWISVGV
jgi:hypothetical protein